MKSVSKSERSKLVEECIKGRILETPSETSCEKIDECRDFCSVYPFPDIMWRNGGYCPMATHSKPMVAKDTGKVRVGQQKQKKKK
jgi:hypothetical protein